MPHQKYLVAARKYRPQRFDELVAQEHVTETLKNAIRLDRLAHAYLFSGPRGVGKTTAARILAKAINCTAPPEERAGAAEPCRQCDSCRAFEEGRSLNIIEIDAASNNKVEDIRELRDTVRIPPQGSRKKVYIVDEVHMLSNAAFNALLKTLEEPPPYVLFIFATTEPHKVLPTILSRCQRFDFRRIAVPETVTRLQEICEAEGITADEASLLLLARKGDGALRDALSAFDQAVSLCGTDLQYAALAQALGVVDTDLFFDVTANVQTRDSAGMLRLVERIVRAGYDLQEFVFGLAEHLRNLLVACSLPDTELIEATKAVRQRYAEASQAFAEADLLRLLMIATDAEEEIKNSTQPRLKLELALLKMAGLAHAADLTQALAQLDRLEALARQGRLPAAPAGDEAAVPRHLERAPPSASPAPSSPPSPSPDGEVAPQPSKPASTAPSSPAPTPAQDHSRANAAPSDQPEPDEEAPPEAPDETPPAPPPPAAPEQARTHATIYPSLFGTPALKRKKQEPEDPAPGASPHAVAPGAATHAANSREGGAAVLAMPEPRLQRITAAWSRYVQAIKAERIHVGALLQHTAPVEVQSGAVTVAVPDAFHQRLLLNQHDFLLKHLAALTDVEVARLQFLVRQGAEPQAGEETAAEIDPYEYMQRKRRESPVIRAIFDHFGGELVW